MDNIGNIIKKRREELNLSQTELANLIGLTSSSVSLIEKGDRRPSFEILKALANALKVTTDYLIGREEIPDNLQIAFRGAGELTPEFQEMVGEYIDLLKKRQAKKEGKEE